jgi:hypothetical protein
MSKPPTFDEMIRAFAGDPAVAPSGRKGFARASLMKNGKMFASVRDDRLLLKLPADRVEELIASGLGLPFDANKGKPMREWVIVTAEAGPEWIALARESAAFAG